MKKYNTVKIALLLLSSCSADSKKELKEEVGKEDIVKEEKKQVKIYAEKPAEKEESDWDGEWWRKMPWEKSIRNIVFAADGTPFKSDIYHPSYYRITKTTRDATMEAHRQISSAVGLKASGDNRPKLASFLTARASIETSMQGSVRPFDTRGSVHSLDVSAAYQAGIRNRKKYTDAGNVIAKDRPYWFLGYGQGGMISWFFLDKWDILGDPRMLGDTVISGMTYRRALSEKYEQMKRTTVRCYEYDDSGKMRVLNFSGKAKKYRVQKYKIDEEKYNACMDGRKGKKEKDAIKECRANSKIPYRWKPGLSQPENTVKVNSITWWYLKQAVGGRPCPPWKGDEYEKYARNRFKKRARIFDLDSESVVRRYDLGQEPDGVDQYELWKDIWDNTVSALGGAPIDWNGLLLHGEEREGHGR